MKWILMMIMMTVQPTVPAVPERPPIQEVGKATWYGAGNWHGDYTASGERFRPDREVTCAHRTLPLQTVVLVEHDGRAIWCRINDRGPYMARPAGGGPRRFPGTVLPPGHHWDGVLDMSTRAAKKLGIHTRGIAQVTLRYWTPG